MSRPILGIDPGLDGALALLHANDALELYPTPVIQGPTRRHVDLAQLAHLVDGIAKHHAAHVWIEHVGPRPKDGVVQAFSFGCTFTALRMACIAHFMPLEEVTPPSWRKVMGLPPSTDKDASRARASALFPQHAHHWPLKKDHDKAEAVLIAAYGRGVLARRAAA